MTENLLGGKTLGILQDCWALVPLKASTESENSIGEDIPL